MTKGKQGSIQPHVFVVDDDRIVRDVARVSLEEAGFVVSEAENGVQALDAVGRIRPDIILLDL
jgi:CheY-like chemotaxis protein